MQLNDLISSISHSISALSDRYPALGPMAEISLNAVKASADRASLQEPRLSRAARMSICSAAMQFASYALSNSVEDDDVADLMRNILLVAPMHQPDHSAFDDHDAPEGYSGASKGPFSKRMNDTNFLIVRRPHTYGGNWTLTINGIPSVNAETPSEVAEKGSRLEALLAPQLGMYKI